MQLHVDVSADSNMIVTTVVARTLFLRVLGRGQDPLLDVTYDA